MVEPLPAEPRSDAVARVRQWQRDARACPEVFAVVIRCDGEASVSSLYDTREAAEIEREWHNRKSAYYGRAHIEVFNVMNMDLSRRRFTP